MDPHDEAEPGQLEMIGRVFKEQLLACLEECARGRRGLFSELSINEDEPGAWREAARLRELAFALQSIFAQQDERNPLCDEFLDLCTIHGENNPGEPRLARAFLARIEKGEVGTQPEGERKPW
jgi:hypothetical protein